MRTDDIIKVITYSDQNQAQKVCFVHTDGKVSEMPFEIASVYIAEILNKKGYKRHQASEILNDSIFALNQTEEEKERIVNHIKDSFKAKKPAVKRTRGTGRIAPVLGFANRGRSGVFSRVATRIKNLKVRTKLFIAAAATVATMGVHGYILSKQSPSDDQNVTGRIETESNIELITPQTEAENITVQEENSESLWQKTMKMASIAQQHFMNAALSFAETIENFNQNHRETNVTFEDGHVEDIVEFGFSPEEFASAYILGANFTNEDFSKFMNASNINIDEYTKHFKNWFKMTYYQYLVRNSQEDTGILDAASASAEATEHLKLVDDLHKQLRQAQETGDFDRQMEIVNQLYIIKNASFKIEEAAQLEPTYENFQALNIPDYVLLTKPIYDSIAIQYRNTLMNDGKQFYNELDGKVFGEDGIYCRIYEWTMQENVEYQNEKISQLGYSADESYADYSALLKAIRDEEALRGLLKDETNKNRYAVENLEGVKRALEIDYSYRNDDSKENTDGNSDPSYGGGGSTTTRTRTETKTRTKTTKEKVEEKDLTEKEKKSVEKQKKQIQEELDKKTEENKKEAEEKAEQQAESEQKVENEKKEQLESEVESENKKTEDSIENMEPGEKIPENVEIQSEYHDETDPDKLGGAVGDVTTDGTGAVDKDTPLPDPEDYYNQTHPQEDTSNNNESVNTGNQESSSNDSQESTSTPSTSEQSDSIIEGEEAIPSASEEVPVDSATVTVDVASSTEEVYAEPASVEATDSISTDQEVYAAPTTQDVRQALIEQAAAEIVEEMETQGYFDDTDELHNTK